jgi:hypothetical protein
MIKLQGYYYIFLYIIYIELAILSEDSNQGNIEKALLSRGLLHKHVMTKRQLSYLQK